MLYAVTDVKARVSFFRCSAGPDENRRSGIACVTDKEWRFWNPPFIISATSFWSKPAPSLVTPRSSVELNNRPTATPRANLARRRKKALTDLTVSLSVASVFGPRPATRGTGRRRAPKASRKPEPAICLRRPAIQTRASGANPRPPREPRRSRHGPSRSSRREHRPSTDHRSAAGPPR